jgi:hypothetical protein
VTTLAVEINDAGLQILREAGTGAGRVPPSPGYALIDGDTLLTGSEAASLARLKPRKINNRFWSELDTTPLPRPFPDHFSHADLAHAHLAGIWERARPGVGEVILAVPGFYTETQLGLMLGIARACGMPVAGLVDAAVAAAAGSPGEHLLHLDLQLHRVVLTEMVQGPEVVRQRVEVLRQVGLVPLWDTWARQISAAFVKQSRFDPGHTAEAEQTLYRNMPALLEELSARDETALEMEAGGRPHTARLTRREMVGAVATEYERIIELVRLLKPAGRRATILLSHRAAALPGLKEQLAGIVDTDVIGLPEEAATAATLQRRDAIRSPGEALPFVTRLAGGTAPPVRKRVTAAGSRSEQGHGETATASGPGQGQGEVTAGAGAKSRPSHHDATMPPTPAMPAPGSAGPALSVPPSTVARRTGRRPTHVLLDGVAHAITTEPLVLGVAVPGDRRGVKLRGQTAGISRRHCSIARQGDVVQVEDHSTHGSFLNGQRILGSVELVTGDRLRLGSPGIELQLICVVEDDGAPSD